jgi:hypothetical protein
MMDNKNDLNSFYYDLLNISKRTNALDTINNIVSQNKKELKDIGGSVEGLCKVAANNISLELHSKNIMHRILNTKEILECYEHVFIIACYKEQEKLNYILIDPTYEQFYEQQDRILMPSFEAWPSTVLCKTGKGKSLLNNLLTKGYSAIDEVDVKLYLGSFVNEIDPNIVGVKLSDVMTDSVVKKTR